MLEERLGEIRKNKCGTDMKIVKYYGHSDITVKFVDQYEAEVDTTYFNFIRGQVKNPYDKTVNLNMLYNFSLLENNIFPINFSKRYIVAPITAFL